MGDLANLLNEAKKCRGLEPLGRRAFITKVFRLCWTQTHYDPADLARWADDGGRGTN
jgi:hypothetical protein